MNFYKNKSNDNINPELLGKTCDNTGEEYDLQDKVRMKLKISRKNKLIYQEDFYNQIFLPNLSLLKTEDYSIDKLNMKNIHDFKLDVYNFEIILDSSEIPLWIKNYKSFDNEFIGWVLRCHSTSKVNFFIDTIKEDTENFIKESWELDEPGRKDKAALSRKKFLLYNKKKNGELMTIEEEEILALPKKKKIKIRVEEKEKEKEKPIEKISEKDEGEKSLKSGELDSNNLEHPNNNKKLSIRSKKIKIKNFLKKFLKFHKL